MERQQPRRVTHSLALRDLGNLDNHVFPRDKVARYRDLAIYITVSRQTKEFDKRKDPSHVPSDLVLPKR